MYWTQVKFNIVNDKNEILGRENKLIFNPAVNPKSSKEQWDSVKEFYAGLGLKVQIIELKRV